MEIREVGKNIDLMVDIHGPPWLNTRDAISLGKRLEEFDLLFYEDPVAPENIEAISFACVSFFESVPSLHRN